MAESKRIPSLSRGLRIPGSWAAVTVTRGGPGYRPGASSAPHAPPTCGVSAARGVRASGLHPPSRLSPGKGPGTLPGEAQAWLGVTSS